MAPKYEEKKAVAVEPKIEPIKDVGKRPQQVTKVFINKPNIEESNTVLSLLLGQMEQAGYTYHNYIPQSANEKILIFKLTA